MKWITRSAVRIDRVACPWLIKRFVDSEAEFLFVPKNQVVQIAADTGAIPFDIPGVELGHHNDCCTFEAILNKYDLTDPALHRLARIVRDADIGKDGERDPVAEGLRAIAVGYSLRYPDDTLNIEQQFVVYDSLFSWCRMEVARHGA
jgi:hypothetical protein